MDAVMDWVRAATSATTTTTVERVQSLWDGYGEVLRVGLAGADATSVIVKEVRPPAARGRSHARKLRSYAVERAFYLGLAARCDARCRVARCIAADTTTGAVRLLLEDLDAAGFGRRRDRADGAALDACLGWLARFHARFLGARPDDLWQRGTYWHLATRPDELEALPRDLRAAALAIDARLEGATHRTLVHGDAKLANFCFGEDGVAAVDFQYVGGGVGVQDLVYLLFAAAGWGQRGGSEGAIDAYFAHLRAALDAEGVDAAPVEAEWRALVPYARADFLRFYAGWAPSARSLADYRASVEALSLGG